MLLSTTLFLPPYWAQGFLEFIEEVLDEDSPTPKQVITQEQEAYRNSILRKRNRYEAPPPPRVYFLPLRF